MQKRSKPASIQANGTWQSKHGLLYKFDIAMEDGNTGQYMSQKQDQDKFIIGVECDYIYDDTNKEYPKIKPFSPQQGFTAPKKDFPDKAEREHTQRQIVRQSCLNAP